ncbi:D-alanyl-D-alanine endopeptidase [Bordetella trematum]|uniref:D-alanyl-D-alanine endopeptidase n=1 Tax=Bordetella trematum TaxID=123899 RepID=UPI000D9F4705|nr:D-alanyl-D-alanine endopeptidase [Bordetella trematum]SPU54130.1 D-alanyl-D-alanine carboxypeptidase [Bordetella trematum]VDH08144.1 D-alanyl-D-alanine endopeptidase precursor [Bordetella trematum]
MAISWMRLAARAVAPLALTAAMFSAPALAAKATDPCKTNAKSAECRAAKKKAPAAKTAASKPAAKTAAKAAPKATSRASAKPAAKAAAKAPAKTASKASAKSTTKARSKTASKASPKVAARKTPASGKKAAPKNAKARHAAAAAAGAAVIEPALVSVAEDVRSLRSSTAYVMDLETSTVLFAKNDKVVRPIASISKLMTALVVVDANLPMDEMLEITDEDIDTLKHTTSRLSVGTRLSRGDMLHLALMSSENRAANALGRNYPGGLPAFVRAMNAKAATLGMVDSRFVEPTGLSAQNVSSPRDLSRLLRAASQRPLIHRYSTDSEYEVEVNKRAQTFRNTNLLVRKPDWDIKVSKTGFINEAGECLVMLTRVNGRDLAIVLLDSQGKLSRIGDAVRLRRIVQSEVAML